MTDLHDAARAIVERTTQAQGLPFHVTDPTVLARTAALLAPCVERSAPARTKHKPTTERPAAA